MSQERLIDQLLPRELCSISFSSNFGLSITCTSTLLSPSRTSSSMLSRRRKLLRSWRFAFPTSSRWSESRSTSGFPVVSSSFTNKSSCLCWHSEWCRSKSSQSTTLINRWTSWLTALSLLQFLTLSRNGFQTRPGTLLISWLRSKVSNHLHRIFPRMLLRDSRCGTMSLIRRSVLFLSSGDHSNPSLSKSCLLCDACVQIVSRLLSITSSAKLFQKVENS